MTQLDRAFFQYISDKLRNATPEQICNYYVQNLVFKNEGYLEYLQQEYRLPNDMLKMHSKICKLAEAPA